MKWLTSRTVLIQIITALIGIMYVIDESFGTRIMSNEIAGLIVTILASLGIYTRVNARIK